MDISPDELHHHIQVSQELKRQHDIHKLRDELGLEPQGTLEHVAHLERFLPSQKALGDNTKKFWLELLAAALNADEVPFFLDDTIGQWLIQVLPQLGYQVKLEIFLDDNIGLAHITNVAQSLHEGILDLACALEFTRLSDEGKFDIPALLRGHELNQFKQAAALAHIRGVLDSQLLLNCIAVAFDSHDHQPDDFPPLAREHRSSLYDWRDHTIYIDTASAWQPQERRYVFDTIRFGVLTNLRHYLVHYLDGRIAQQLGNPLNSDVAADRVSSYYLENLHQNFV